MNTRSGDLRAELYAKLKEHAGTAEFLHFGSLDGVSYWNLQDQQQEWFSPDLKALLGYTEDEVPDQAAWWQERVFPDDAPRIAETFKRHLEEGTPCQQVIRFRHKDGSLVWVRCRGLVLRDERGIPCRLLAAYTDVTELLRTRDELQSTLAHMEELVEERTANLARIENRLNAVLDSSPDGLLIVNGEQRITYMNARAEEMLGYAAGELTGQAIDILVPPQHRDRHASLVEGFFAEGRSRPMSVGKELNAVRKDGTEIPVEIALAPLADNGRRSVIATIRDTSAHRKLTDALRETEERLRQTQRLEAVGKLAGGVAHDFNNILTVISGYSELVQAEDNLSARGLAGIGEVSKAAARGASLTRQLLAFSRRQVLQPRPVNLTSLVTDMRGMLRPLIREDIEVVTRFTPDLGNALVDPGQMEQVLVNLVVNARDAMPDGGRLLIETMSASVNEKAAARHIGVVPGAYVVLSVSDTGVGMDSATLSRIFEPFFTTKEHGKGTGLGLSTVYGIVKQSGGNVWVYSEPGRGTTFRVYLPRVEDVVAEVVRLEAAPTAAGEGGETILVVEDDPSLRELFCQVLRSQGYEVLSTENGAHALRLCEEHRATIHLVLTDLVMPEMGGIELMERLASVRPDAKVVYMSGYTEAATFRSEVLPPSAAYLQKPFTPRTLLEKVREVLTPGT